MQNKKKVPTNLQGVGTEMQNKKESAFVEEMDQIFIMLTGTQHYFGENISNTCTMYYN